MTRHRHGGYATAENADHAPPGRAAPKDLAFADTVVALEDEIPTSPVSRPPPSMRSGPPSRRSGPPPSYDDGSTRQHEMAALHAQRQAQLTMQSMPPPSPISQGPASYPSPSQRPPGYDPGLATSVRGAYERAKYTIDTSRDEMKELWSATESTDPSLFLKDRDPVARLARRVRTFWSFFEWDKDDLARAAWIGIAVFIIAVCSAFILFR